MPPAPSVLTPFFAGAKGEPPPKLNAGVWEPDPRVALPVDPKSSAEDFSGTMALLLMNREGDVPIVDVPKLNALLIGATARPPSSFSDSVSLPSRLASASLSVSSSSRRSSFARGGPSKAVKEDAGFERTVPAPTPNPNPPMGVDLASEAKPPAPT